MAEKTDKASDQDPTDSTDSEMDETDIDLRTRHCHDCDIVPPNNAACESGVRNTKMDTIRGATATLPCLKSECDDDNSESGFKTRTRSLTFRRKKSEKPKEINKKRKNFWSFRLKSKLPGRFRRGTDHGLPDQKPVDQSDANSCVCTGYRRTENDGKSTNSTDHTLSNTAEVPRRRQNEQLSELARMLNVLIPPPVRVPVGTMESVLALTNLDLTGDEFPIEDIETIMMRRRAHEIEHGIDATPRAHYPHFGAANRRPSHSNSAVCQAEGNSPPHLHVSRDSETHIVHFDADLAVASIREALQKQCTVGSTPSFPSASTTPLPRPVPTRQLCVGESHHRYDEFDDFSPIATFTPQQPVHTQVDYVHCLVPDLKDIVKCSFYWGVMDRYEAERLLENKPEGTFLLRDSAQEEFLFSVSFRRYGRSLHARIEQWNHKFSFDSHDPGVYAADSVCGLIEHYKDPSCCMFFEPMLTIPLNRNFPFSLQQSCRGVICTHTTYDGINLLPLPKSLKKKKVPTATLR